MKPSVLFFCPTFSSGGVEKVLINLANYFCERGYNTSFLVCRRIGPLEPHLNKEVIIHSLNKRVGKCFFEALSFFWQQNPAVVICGPQFINILTVVILKIILRRRTKVILTHHSFYDFDVKKMIFWKMFYKSSLRSFYKYSDVIVAVSQAVKDHLVNDIPIPEHKIQVIYNPVIESNFGDLKGEKTSHRWLNGDRDFKVIVCVGRLSRIKNPTALVRLMPDLVKMIDCRLILIGDGEQHQFLEDLVNELKMTKYIDIHGAVSNPLKYISRSDLVIIPSISETFSMVGVESIAAGIPVLSTPTQGVMEVLENCEGCFFESIGNREAFMLMIRHLLTTKGITVNEGFAEKFSVNSIGKIYEDLVIRD